MARGKPRQKRYVSEQEDSEGEEFDLESAESPVECATPSLVSSPSSPQPTVSSNVPTRPTSPNLLGPPSKKGRLVAEDIKHFFIRGEKSSLIKTICIPCQYVIPFPQGKKLF
jgi:hypothetical protein